MESGTKSTLDRVPTSPSPSLSVLEDSRLAGRVDPPLHLRLQKAQGHGSIAEHNVVAHSLRAISSRDLEATSLTTSKRRPAASNHDWASPTV